MRTFTLPGIVPALSVIGMGAGNLGTRVDRDDSFRLLDFFREKGGTVLDTAHIYAAWVPQGAGMSERTLGAWIKSRGIRDEMVVGTKGGHPDLRSMSISRLSAAELEQDLQESLERLEMDFVDLYWLHRDDVSRPVDEMVETLAGAVRSGSVRAYGISNWSPARIQEAMDYAHSRDLPAPASNQIGWSLATRNPGIGDPTTRFMDDESMAYHRRTNLMAAAYSSQANGFFAGNYGNGMLPPTPGIHPGVVSAYYNETNFARLERARKLADAHRCTANDIALAYLCSQSFPVCALVGCSSLEHLKASLTGADLQLSDEDCTWLESGLPFDNAILQNYRSGDDNDGIHSVQ